jgi:hypothetical protein
MNFVFKLLSYIFFSFEPCEAGWGSVVCPHLTSPHLTSPHPLRIRSRFGATNFWGPHFRETARGLHVVDYYKNYPIPGLQDYSPVLNSLLISRLRLRSHGSFVLRRGISLRSIRWCTTRESRFKAMVDPEQSAILETSPVPLLR